MKIKLINSKGFLTLIIKAGYSTTTLADGVNVSKGHIYKLVHYNGAVSPKVAKSICEILNKEFDEIFFLESLSTDSKQKGSVSNE